jgi:pyrimidine deaminase RibD-like protein
MHKVSKKFIRLANKAAEESKHHQHLMAAVVTKGGAVLSMEANAESGRGHAEARALRPHHDYRGATIYIVRLNGRRVSKPCPNCTKKIKDAGISTVVFTDVDGVEKSLHPNEITHESMW